MGLINLKSSKLNTKLYDCETKVSDKMMCRDVDIPRVIALLGQLKCTKGAMNAMETESWGFFYPSRRSSSSR